MAVLIGVRCLKFVEKQIQLPLEHLILLTDSQCVLQWLSLEKSLPVFIKNRVKEINSYSDITCSFVKSTDNIADVASRGSTLVDLCKNQIYWHGSKMLQKIVIGLQEKSLCYISEEDYEFNERKNECQREDIQTLFDVEISDEPKEDANISESDYLTEDCLLTENNKEEKTPFGIDVNKFSSISKLIRVTAWCNRFIRNAGSRSNRSHTLSIDEINEAEQLLLKQIQRNHFADVFQSIQDERPNNLVKQLDLFVDESEMIRCGGRLQHANLCEAARRPILLPRKDKFTILLIERMYNKILHSGVSQTLSETRQRFWIPRGRATIRSVLKSCRVCRRVEGGPYKLPSMAPLPRERVTETTPFSSVGLDYLGPLYIKENNEI
ncbi:uncharacterized protein LOC132753737 [Ruditapes philippinarum]|uniref:uncharacterized protein LOC132753737 n=1 Tax=Ruditapes philippinarum TaxID=129788 RepID=UPI00295B7D40|nr:uncharacterized protein LOC132753737 [Ruditapes philippinarum]